MRKKGPGSIFSALGWGCLVFAVAFTVVGVGGKNMAARYAGIAFGAASAFLFAQHMKRN